MICNLHALGGLHNLGGPVQNDESAPALLWPPWGQSFVSLLVGWPLFCQCLLTICCCWIKAQCLSHDMDVLVGLLLTCVRTFSVSDGKPGGSVVKNLPAKQEMQVRSLGWADPLEKEMATNSSILAWEITWQEEPGGLQPRCCRRVRHDLATKQQQQK